MPKQNLNAWIGREHQVEDSIPATPVRGMATLLNKDLSETEAATALPLLWHWLYFLDMPAQNRLANDGHAERGDFLPPITLPRRMWASSKVTFHQAIRIGSDSLKQSRISAIEEKQGRSGSLAFVTVQHEYYCDSALAVSEEQNIVYREASSAKAQSTGGKTAPASYDFQRQMTVNETLLFRYSALTFNAHRIHYDREYAMHTEAYPGLVVHGPLLATLLLDLLQAKLPERKITEFEFRALQPVFDIDSFSLCGQMPDDKHASQLWISNSQGHVCMEASATLAP